MILHSGKVPTFLFPVRILSPRLWDVSAVNEHPHKRAQKRNPGGTQALKWHNLGAVGKEVCPLELKQHTRRYANALVFIFKH